MDHACKEEGCVEALYKPYSSFLENLRRFRYTDQHDCRACGRFPKTTVGDFFHTLFRLVEPYKWHGMAMVLDVVFGCKPCHHKLRKIFKALTGLIKLGGSYITPHWRNFCYWEASLGYAEYGPLEDMEEDVRKWLVEPRVNGEFYGVENYHIKLYNKVRSFLQQHWKRPENVPNVADWLSRAAWMRGRGGTGKKVTVSIDGKNINTRSNKGVDAAFKADVALSDELVTVYPQRMVVMQKSEPSKVRAVAKTDNELFRKMDFLSELVEGGLYGCNRSSLFLGSLGNENLDYHILDNISRGLNVPLDQGSFDHNQGKTSILTVMMAVFDVIIKNEKNEEYKNVWQAMWDSFTHPESAVILGQSSFNWGNGVASGWRWTGLLDTLLNIGSYDTIVTEIEREVGTAFWDSVHQGDDIHFKATNVEAINKLVQAFNGCGYEIHPQKTYISRTRTEFLRRSYEVNGIAGYLPRTINSLLYRNPITEQPLSRATRVYDRMSLLVLAVLRGGNIKEAVAMLLEDSAQLNLKPNDVCDFLLTPNCVGGAGVTSLSGPLHSELLPYSTGRWLVPKAIEVTKKTLVVPLGAWQERINTSGVRMHDDILQGFYSDLVHSWGLRKADLAGRIKEEWIEVEKLEPLPISGGMDLPSPSAVWVEENIPTMLAPHWKKQLIRDDQYKKYIKPECREIILTLRKRISSSLLEDYLLGMVKVPSPLVEGVALKYGQQWKEEAIRWVMHALSSQSCDRKIFTRKMLWLENITAQHIHNLTTYKTLAL